MVARIERLAEDLRGSYPDVAAKLYEAAIFARNSGVPEELARETDLPRLAIFRGYREISLSEEHQIQSFILAGRFAARLGMSKAAYIATLPQFPEKPANYSELGLNVPVIVETRIPWMDAAELSGICLNDYLRGANPREVSDWEDDNFRMPKVPFSAWAQDGTKFIFRKPSDVRNELLVKKENSDYRAGRILDGIAIWNVRRDLFKTILWDVIGTGVGSDLMLVLSSWFAQPRLCASRVDCTGPYSRALVLGREIRTLSLAA